MSATLLTTVSNRHVDLSAPRADDIDFDDIAEHLAKEARYNGATPGTFYSVAQHLVLGCDWLDWLFVKPEQTRAAAYYLCHDFPEAYLKDDTTPKKRAADQVAAGFGYASGLISEAYARLTERFDAAIHEAAGLPWPMPKDIEAIVHDIDRRMLVTEWKALRNGHDLPAPYADDEALPIKIDAWPWQFAQEMLADRMHALLPALRKTLGD